MWVHHWPSRTPPTMMRSRTRNIRERLRQRPLAAARFQIPWSNQTNLRPCFYRERALEPLAAEGAEVAGPGQSPPSTALLLLLLGSRCWNSEKVPVAPWFDGSQWREVAREGCCLPCCCQSELEGPAAKRLPVLGQPGRRQQSYWVTWGREPVVKLLSSGKRRPMMKPPKDFAESWVVWILAARRRTLVVQKRHLEHHRECVVALAE